MLSLIDSANEVNTEQTMGNVKLKTTVYGDNAEVILMYTANGFDYSTKRIRMVFQNHVLQELSDDWFLYTVSDAPITVSREQAIQIARTAAQNFEWTADGEQVTDFNILTDSAVFVPHPRTESLTLVPYWYVTLYLDKEYPGGVNSITSGVWADTGEVANMQALSSQVGV